MSLFEITIQTDELIRIQFGMHDSFALRLQIVGVCPRKGEGGEQLQELTCSLDQSELDLSGSVADIHCFLWQLHLFPSYYSVILVFVHVPMPHVHKSWMIGCFHSEKYASNSFFLTGMKFQKIFW